MEWVSVFDGLPEDGVSVLVVIRDFDDDYKVEVSTYTDGEWDIDVYDPLHRNEVLYWMPLPELPAGLL